MSYILDALKKSEQARLNVDTPLRQLLLRSEEMSRESRRVWPYVAGAALLLNAAALYLWWRMSSDAAVERWAQPTQPVTPKQALLPKAPAPVPPANGAARSAVPADTPIVRDNPTPLPAASRRPVAPSPAVSAAPPVAAAPTAQPATIPGIAPRTASGASGASVSATAVVAPPVAGETGKQVAGDPQALDLPEPLRRELPQLVMSGMVRVMGAPVWVVVNERPFREGEEVAPGLRVEKILERGALFSYKGYRFQRLLTW
jgi:general secretion pathway protein B